MAQDVLFITRNDVVRFTATNGNVDVDRYLTFVKQAQDLMVQPLLGTKLFEKLKADIIAGTLADPYLTLLEDKIKPIVIQYTMVKYLRWASVQISNKGVFKFTQENGVNIDSDELALLMEDARSTGEHYAQRFIDWMAFNNSQIPEYNNNVNDDMYPTRTNFFGGWVV